MNDLKGLADVADRLIYEALGLLLPGALALLLLSVWLVETPLGAALAFGDAHPWIALSACYAAGYVVQGLPRPIVNLSGALYGMPWHLLLFSLGLVDGRARDAVRQWVGCITDWLQSGQRHAMASTMPDSVDLMALARDRWRKRLELTGNRDLDAGAVRDLSYSVLETDARRRLERFRASASCARAFAAITAAAADVSLIRIIEGLVSGRSLCVPLTGVFAGLLVSFYALRERAEMYDGLWRAIVVSQFLAMVEP